jgi:hypothetical protein
MNLIEKFKEEQAESLAAAWKRYGELLEKEDGSAADAAELKRLAKLLAKTAKEMEEDQKTLRNLRHYESTLVEGSGLEAASQEANAEVQSSFERTQEQMTALQEQHRQIVMRSQEMGNRLNAAQSAGYRIGEMKVKHPDLLKHVRVPSQAAIAEQKIEGLESFNAAGQSPALELETSAAEAV